MREETVENQDKLVDICLEKLCAQGCRQVNGFIEDLEQGRPVPGTEQLSPFQLRLLLREMRSVMAVYAVRGGCGLV
jgi:hypothetical protein